MDGSPSHATPAAPAKLRVDIIHWNAAEAQERAKRLRALGFDSFALGDSPREFTRHWAEALPQVIVIDLERLPAQGRDHAREAR